MIAESTPCKECKNASPPVNVGATNPAQVGATNPAQVGAMHPAQGGATPSSVYYHTYEVAEMDFNPLIAALPHVTDDEDVQTKRLMMKPAFSENERNLSNSIRIMLLSRLKYHFYYPSPLDVRIYKSVEEQIISGYWTRNPITPSGQAILHGLGDEENKHRRPWCPEICAGTISLMYGASGRGKTALLNAITRAMGSVMIVHTHFRGKNEPLLNAQITVLKRNMTDQPNSMIKGISKVLADRVDEVLGSDDYGPMFMDKSLSRTHYVSELRRIIRKHWIGIVIIDAFEHVSLAGTKGQKELLNVLDNLRDELGVPILLASTYECSDLLSLPSLRTTRRLIDGGVYELVSPERTDFDTFCDKFWGLQWVRKPIPLSSPLRDLMYEYSQGINAILLLLFRFAQEQAIREGIETVNEAVLNKVYKERLRPLHGVLQAIKKGDVRKYDDLYFKTMSELDPNDPITRIAQMSAAGNGVSSPDVKSTASRGASKATMKVAMGHSQRKA